MINVNTKLVPGTEEFEKASAVDQYVARVIDAFNTIKKRNAPAFDNWTINSVYDIFSYMSAMQHEYQSALMTEQKDAYKYPSMLSTLIMVSKNLINSGVFVNNVKNEIVFFENQIERGIEKFTVGLFSRYTVHAVIKDLTELSCRPYTVSDYELIQYYAHTYENLFPFGIPNIFAEWCVGNVSDFDKTLDNYDNCDFYPVVFYRRTNSICKVLEKLNKIYPETDDGGRFSLEHIIAPFYLSDSNMMICDIGARCADKLLVLMDPDQQDVEFINKFRKLSEVADRYWNIELNEKKTLYTFDEFMNAIGVL